MKYGQWRNGILAKWRYNGVAIMKSGINGSVASASAAKIK
jgi:hypothetical protein